MTALASTDVTITIEKRSIEGKLRRNRCKIQFGDGNLTYPTGGVAMPAMGSFGMKMRLDYLTVFDESGTGYMYKYDKTNKKLMIYVAPSFTPAGTVALPTFTIKSGTIGTNMSIGLTADATTADVVGGSGITANRAIDTTHTPVGAQAFTGTAVAAAVLSQLANTVAPAAQTLYAEAVGW